MAVVVRPLDVLAYVPPSSNAPAPIYSGTNIPYVGLAFDASADESAYWQLDVPGYSTGSLYVRIRWIADTANTGDVLWASAAAAITPNVDTTSVETKSLAAVSTLADAHLGMTVEQLHEIVVEVSNTDSIAAGDFVWVLVRRSGSSTSDTLAGDVIYVGGTLEYTGSSP